MADDTLKIFVWPDGHWVSEEDVDDLDWYIASAGKGDDFAEYEVPLDLEADDIQELIDLQALPGMLPDKPPVPEGKITVPEGSIVIVHHSKDIDYNAVTMLEDKMIVNAPNTFIEIIHPMVKDE